MIIFVIVPPDVDMFNQRTMHDLFYNVIDLPRVIFVVSHENTQAWWEARPWCEVLGYYMYDLRRIRQTILDEFEDEDIHVIARYDLSLLRRLPRIKRLRGCTKIDIITMIEWFSAQMCNHGSISEQRRNKKEAGKGRLNGASSLLNFYRPAAVIGHNFLNAPETLIDPDLTLSLLRNGYENVVNYEFACRSTADKVIAINKDDAFKLEQRHKGFVEAVETKPGTWNVTCQWRRAYDSGR